MQDREDAHPRYYFLLAPSYHGSTLMCKLAVSHPDVVSLADTFPTRAFDQTCGCGQMVSRCSFWQRVRSEAETDRFGACGQWLPTYPGESQSGLSGISRRVALVAREAGLIHPKSGLPEFRKDYESYVRACMHGNPDASVFLDGGKSLVRLRSLREAGLPVAGVVILRRDPVDYTASLKRNSRAQPSLTVGALHFRHYHKQALRVAEGLPVMSLDYKNLASDPTDSLNRLWAFMGLKGMDWVAIERNTDTWHFMGNSSVLAFAGVRPPRTYQVSALKRRWVTLLGGFREAKSG